LKKVLIVEDNANFQSRWAHELKGKILTIKALDVSSARRLFAEHPDVDAIAIDACVPGNHPNTHALVREIRSTFHGPMIAISGSARYRIDLLSAGCTYACRKDALSHKLKEILNLNSS
jgi:CheY-like chemotaxis protein